MAKINNLSHMITVINLGLSDTITKMCCNIPLLNSGATTWNPQNIDNKKNTDINFFPETEFDLLDNLVDKKIINNIGIIHLDAEGHELDILKGSTKSIKNSVHTYQLRMDIIRI